MRPERPAASLTPSTGCSAPSRLVTCGMSGRMFSGDSPRYRARWPPAPPPLVLAVARRCGSPRCWSPAPPPRRPAPRGPTLPRRGRLPAVGHRRRAGVPGRSSGTAARAGQLRLTTPARDHEVGRDAVRRGQLDLAVGQPRLRAHRAGAVVDRDAPRGHARRRSTSAASARRGTRSSWDTLGRWASGDAPFRRTSLGSAARRPGPGRTDTWVRRYGGLRSWQLRVPLLRRAGTRPTPPVGTVGAMVSDLPHVDRVTTSSARRRARDRARRPALLADGARRRVPAVRRRRRGLVLADRPPRWCSAYYARLPPPRPYAWVQDVVRRPVGRPRRADDLRRRLRRHRQLAVQHRLRRAARRARVRDPVRVAARGRAVHQGRHPGRHLDHLRPRRALRRPDLRHATATSS